MQPRWGWVFGDKRIEPTGAGHYHAGTVVGGLVGTGPTGQMLEGPHIHGAGHTNTFGSLGLWTCQLSTGKVTRHRPGRSHSPQLAALSFAPKSGLPPSFGRAAEPVPVRLIQP